MITVMNFQLHPFPTPGMIPYFARLTEQNTNLSNSWHHVLPPSFTTPSLTLHAYASLRPATFQAAGEAPCIYVLFLLLYELLLVRVVAFFFFFFRVRAAKKQACGTI